MSRSACILATILLLGCAGTSPESAVSELSTGTYAGDLPCADCPGQRLVVTLFPDGGERYLSLGVFGTAEAK